MKKKIRLWFMRMFVCQDWRRHLFSVSGGAIAPLHAWRSQDGAEAPVFCCRRCTSRVGF